MREEDAAEVKAAGNDTPLSALGSSYFMSHRCYTVTVDGSPEAMFGVAPVTEDFGGVWLLGTSVVFERAPIWFLRQSKKWLDKLSEGFEYVGNCVDERNEKHCSWLEWLGFVPVAFLPEFGFEQRPFIKYVKCVE